MMPLVIVIGIALGSIGLFLGVVINYTHYKKIKNDLIERIIQAETELMLDVQDLSFSELNMTFAGKKLKEDFFDKLSTNGISQATIDKVRQRFRQSVKEESERIHKIALEKTQEVLQHLNLLSIPVSYSVPAGGFGAVGHDLENTLLGVTEVSIEDEPYTIHSLRGNAQHWNEIVINPAERYHTVRVTGNSMNNAKPIPIENGDYILVRLQNHASDYDIVIANLNEPDPLGTVKRLGFTGEHITLRPESLDPNIQNDPDFDRAYSMDEVRISGIVEAVFKKKR